MILNYTYGIEKLASGSFELLIEFFFPFPLYLIKPRTTMTKNMHHAQVRELWKIYAKEKSSSDTFQ